ncbi:hypothetical protein Dsin_030968 [Dipteronia sinensis]|uniref:Reverse transcriptase zinc-binding domain-containing protein n=1 Tax=Dipteronia sinensis TaxID=43782 RepID=A0AAD9ZKP2_9ROSI|nr:hypothetical protein Dsin_030968 [Dipteronia sinensis]
MKIKIFLWKASHEWLPTLVNLARKKIQMNGLCPVCALVLMRQHFTLFGIAQIKKACNLGMVCQRVYILVIHFCLRISSTSVQTFWIKLSRRFCTRFRGVWYLRNRLVHGGGC